MMILAISAPLPRCIVTHRLPVRLRCTGYLWSWLRILSACRAPTSNGYDMEHAWLNSWIELHRLQQRCRFEVGVIFRVSRASSRRSGCWAFAAAAYEPTHSILTVAIFSGPPDAVLALTKVVARIPLDSAFYRGCISHIWYNTPL